MRTLAVGLDLAELAQPVFDAAVALARDLKASLRLVHAVPYPVVPAELDAAAAALMLEGQQEAARLRVKELTDAWASKARQQGVEATAEASLGDPATVLLDAARACGAALVVVGTHGRRGLRRLALGSVAEKVVRHSDRPVLVVPVKH